MRTYALSLLGEMLLFLPGCYDHREVPCSPIEADYLEAGQDWARTHGPKIKAEMEIVWPEQEASLDDIKADVARANVVCGVPTPFGGEPGLESRNVGTDKVLIYTSSESMLIHLGYYEETAWVEDYTFDELIAMALEDPYVEGDVYLYRTSVGVVAGLITHAGGHMALHRDHTQETKEFVEGCRDAKGNYDPAAWTSDEIYSWGTSATYAAYNQFLDFEKDLEAAKDTQP